MLKILRTVDGKTVVLVLSGRIEAPHLPELGALIDAEGGEVALDLKEVTLVDQETIQFLTGRADQVTLRNCPAYIRQWIDTEGRRRRDPDSCAGC